MWKNELSRLGQIIYIPWLFQLSKVYESGSSSNSALMHIQKSSFRFFFFPHFRAYGWHNGLFAKPRLVLSSRLMTLSWFQLLFSTLENTKQHHHESVHPAVMGHGRWAPADWLSAPDGPSMMKRVLISGQTSLKQSTHRRFSLGFMLNS